LDDPNNVHELVSRRDAPIKCARVLPEPLVADIDGCPLFGKRPVLALASASESATSKWPNSMVKLFSVARNEYINQLRFKSRVLQVACNRRVFVVALQNHLYAFDATRMDKVLSLSTFPCPTKTHAVLALGSRWLAYASDEPLPRSAEPEPSALDRVVETASTAATDVAHTLLDFGKKTLNAYWWGENDAAENAAMAVEHAPSTTAEQDARAGAVKVFDVVRLRSVAHFRAHWNPVAALEFDGSGTLLLTAAVDGQTFNVYSLRPPVLAPAGSGSAGSGADASAPGAAISGGGGGAGGGVASGASASSIDVDAIVPRQLYRLVRGFTSAAIQSITFSGDSRFLSVASMRGTTHIYALSPTGGDVTLASHAPATAHAAGVLDKADGDVDLQRGSTPLVTLRALARIKSFTNVATTQGGEVLRVPAIASTALFADAAVALARGARGPRCSYAAVRHGSDARQMFVVTQMGVMTRYQLVPHAPTTPAERSAAPNELCLDAVPVGAWDLCRRVRWDEVKFVPPNEPTLHAVASENPELARSAAADAERASRWLANVEIETHSPHLRPLFIGPQCRVRTFVINADLNKLREEAIERLLVAKEQQNPEAVVHRHKSPMKKKKKNRIKAAAAAASSSSSGADEVRQGRSLQRQSSVRRVLAAQEVGLLLHVDERTESTLVTSRRATVTNSGRTVAAAPVAEHAAPDFEPARSIGRLGDSVVRGDYEPLVDLPAPPPSSASSRAAPSAPPLAASPHVHSSKSAAQLSSPAPFRARLPGQPPTSSDNDEDDAVADQITAAVRDAMATPLRFGAPAQARPASPPALQRNNAPVLAAVPAPVAAPQRTIVDSLVSSSSSSEGELPRPDLKPIDLFDAASYEPRLPTAAPAAKPPVKVSPPKALPATPAAAAGASPAPVFKLAAAPMRISSDGIEPPAAAPAPQPAAAPSPASVTNKLKSYASALVQRPSGAAAAAAPAPTVAPAAPLQRKGQQPEKPVQHEKQPRQRAGKRAGKSLVDDDDDDDSGED
jgi:hypothetical protein